MKILFLMPDNSQMAARQHHQWLEDEMFKIADCKSAGWGKPDYRREKVQVTIDRLYNGDSPDWVIVSISVHDKYWHHYRIPERRDWKIACHCGDMHDNRARSPNLSLIKHRNMVGYDALLLKIMRIRWKGDPDFLRKNLKSKLHHFPFHANPEVVKPAKGPKIWDVTNMGALNWNAYPLRYLMHQNLPALVHQHKFKLLTTIWPPGLPDRSEETHHQRLFIPRLRKVTKVKFLVGKDYNDSVSRSKIMVFDGGWAGYAVQKYFECGFLKTLILANTPMDAKALHLKPGWNFVEINKNNWDKKLLYYLKHENERLEIVKNAYDTMMKYHTSEIRAKQLLKFLEENR